MFYALSCFITNPHAAQELSESQITHESSLRLMNRDMASLRKELIEVKCISEQRMATITEQHVV